LSPLEHVENDDGNDNDDNDDEEDEEEEEEEENEKVGDEEGLGDDDGEEGYRVTKIFSLGIIRDSSIKFSFFKQLLIGVLCPSDFRLNGIVVFNPNSMTFSRRSDQRTLRFLGRLSIESCSVTFWASHLNISFESCVSVRDRFI